MSDRPRPYDPNDPPRFGEWVWVGGLGAKPAIDSGSGRKAIWIAVVVVVALIAWSMFAFRGCGAQAPNAKLIFGEKSLGDDGNLRGRIVITIPNGRYIDAGIDGADIGANISLSGQIGQTVVEVVPARIRYVTSDLQEEVDGKTLLGGEVKIAVTLRGAKDYLPNDVTVSFKTTLVDKSGEKQEEFSGSDTVRFGD
jgi:hypothetical protein